ncbi:hypothetical protein VFPFJ_03852 [Purpureocillium lilacinum]|uniref:Uncharacterized protein n=1 Tax=Purpureocillium lilacinum TaxID=33203 RepID=A0A179GVT5_PURLI|nr:hypothetical protein VFPFJ_03852 [Purpureocillium lilacinum]OAQ82066.1 hypothetical protein VFPBJ_04650 [Purpureocillium lilacinum]OAQ92112.1 hypothetical protein VFPFJ_03852 [Purpureocillium lilacinum]
MLCVGSVGDCADGVSPWWCAHSVLSETTPALSSKSLQYRSAWCVSASKWELFSNRIVVLYDHRSERPSSETLDPSDRRD